MLKPLKKLVNVKTFRRAFTPKLQSMISGIARRADDDEEVNDDVDHNNEELDSSDLGSADNSNHLMMLVIHLM